MVDSHERENDGVFSTLSRNVSSSNGFSSAGSSWSEVGSTEAESEDDEFMAELTRQMADYMLEDEDEYDRNDAVEEEECVPEKPLFSSDLPGPPQRTLTLIPKQDHKAFGDKEDQSIHLCKMENQRTIKNKVKKKVGKEGSGVTKRTELTHQLERKKPDQVPQSRGPGLLGSMPAVWPLLQPQPQANYGSGMRAFFLGGHDWKTKTSGTGVFLPREAGNPQDVRKKLGCSTVLIPARVLHALQLHFQNVNNRAQSNGCAASGNYPLQQDIASSQAGDVSHSHQIRQSQSQNHVVTHHEIDLPKEWTY